MSAPTLATPTQGVSLAQFDPRSGSLVERALFNHRLLVIVLCAVVTLLLGWQATRLQLNASFEKTIPTGHPYIANFLTHQSELSGLGNVVRIAVARPEGSLYAVSYTHLRAHETVLDLVCRLLLEKKNQQDNSQLRGTHLHHLL